MISDFLGSQLQQETLSQEGKKESVKEQDIYILLWPTSTHAHLHE